MTQSCRKKGGPQEENEQPQEDGADIGDVECENGHGEGWSQGEDDNDGAWDDYDASYDDSW
jgi:hypothetical protein